MISISIPQPCTRIRNIPASGRGTIACAHCRKEVVDYSRMTDAAVLDHIRRYGAGCGRFRSDQLGRELRVTDRRRRSFSRKWAAALLLLATWVKEANARQLQIKAHTVQAPAGHGTAPDAQQAQQDTVVKPVSEKPPVYIVDGGITVHGPGSVGYTKPSWRRRARTYFRERWLNLRDVFGLW